jgi:hypothetical protein
VALEAESAISYLTLHQQDFLRYSFAKNVSGCINDVNNVNKLMIKWKRFERKLFIKTFKLTAHVIPYASYSNLFGLTYVAICVHTKVMFS